MGLYGNLAKKIVRFQFFLNLIFKATTTDLILKDVFRQSFVVAPQHALITRNIHVIHYCLLRNTLLERDIYIYSIYIFRNTLLERGIYIYSINFSCNSRQNEEYTCTPFTFRPTSLLELGNIFQRSRKSVAACWISKRHQ